jgi:hypothetical protein
MGLWIRSLVVVYNVLVEMVGDATHQNSVCAGSRTRQLDMTG